MRPQLGCLYTDLLGAHANGAMRSFIVYSALCTRARPACTLGAASRKVLPIAKDERIWPRMRRLTRPGSTSCIA